MSEVLRRRIPAILAVLLLVLSAVSQLLPAHAAATLAINPTRTQEGSSSGVTLVLTVRGVVGGQSYSDYWAVSDPSGKNYTIATTSVASPSGNYTLNEVYPRDFGVGAGITYVGQYSVAIFQTAPTISLLGTGQFGIGITDKLLYQRTQLVSIKATGYKASETVTLYITKGGIAAPGYPIRVPADASGNVITSWLTTARTLTGNYTVSLNGATTGAKNPPDSQWFIILPASLDLSPIAAANSANSLSVSTSVTQPDGSNFIRGNVTGQFSLSGTEIGTPIKLLYDQVRGKWTGNYTVQSTDPEGAWTLQVTAIDPYGNNGQGSTSLYVIPPPAPAPRPPPENQLASLWFLTVITMIAASALIGFVFLRRKRMLPPHLQVDMEAVDVEASRFMDQDFFKSIQEQLAKNKDPLEGEKHG
ncbi:MAG TPA: hypothetical protein VGS11_09830 [Candidatus Bathyarchaeia archaeon]|nr:hypothetical protein [Candidatus Bathyarchaeia archaeon]